MVNKVNAKLSDKQLNNLKSAEEIKSNGKN